MANILAFDILGRDKASAAFNKVAASADKTQASLKRVGSDATQAGAGFDVMAAKGGKLGALAKAGPAILGTSLAAAGVETFKLARNLELMDAKTSRVFADQRADVESWADANAHAMGLTTREAAGLAASFADLLIPMGFSREAAADMSTEVVGLSGALAEWSGGQRTAAEVSQILAKAMLGERESLKELGISIMEADVQARIATKGQQALTGAAREQAEAIATQELIFEKSADAQAAYAEGSDSLARSQAETTAKLKEARDEIVTNLTPAMGSLAESATVAAEGVGILGTALGEASEKGIPLFPLPAEPAAAAAASVLTKTAGLADKTGAALAGAGEDAAAAGPSFDIMTVEVAEAAGAFEAAQLRIEGYSNALRLATDPVFALNSAVEKVTTAQTLYNDAVKAHGPSSAEAQAASLQLADAVSGAEAAAINGNLSFDAFDRKLAQWVEQGVITAGQADAIRGKVSSLRGAAEDYAGNYNATVTVTDRASAALRGIRSWLAGIQSKTVTITARTDIPAGVSIRQLMERQHGGPVRRGDLALVGERGPEIVQFGATGRVYSNAQSQAMARPIGPGGELHFHFHNEGVIGSQRELQDWFRRGLDQVTRNSDLLMRTS